jgi:CHAT domain-containing protein
LSAVAVIPDGEWNRIAWPALWDKAAGQPLVNRVAIVVAPSASMALRGRTRDAWRAETALVVSAPDVSGNPELPSARLEAQDIAGIYASRRVLDGAAATPRAVLEGSAGADVVHVSSHAVDVPAYPQLSHLLLGSEAGSSKLFVGDIANRDLSRTRLVVLAACSTAGTTAVRGEGTIGVAWGFLTAGVHHVIATLQDVEDEPARQLFTRFHKRVAAGESPARALQVTERELAAAGASPRLWAVVAAIGTL